MMKIENWMTLTATLATAMTLSTGCSAAPTRGDRAITATPGQLHTYESDASGFNTKTFFYDNGEEVVVFDTQFTPEAAERSLAFLRTKTQNPISYVVLTHPNPDKFNGMSVFQRLGAKVIASRKTAESIPGVHEYKKYYFVNMARMFTEETYPKPGPVDRVFEQAYDLRLKNGETIRLRELAQPGVSTNQTIASIEAAKAVIVGDLIHHQAHAWLEGGIVNGKPTPSIEGWIADLRELKAMFEHAPETIAYGGRGEAVPVRAGAEAQIAYLRKADGLVSRYLKNLGARASELQGEKAATHYQALQAQFDKAFAAYSLGYMIQYGVYGLVNSKL